MDTQWSSGPQLEHSVEVSGLIMLECSGCGEELLSLGLEEDWPKEHKDAFECACGKLSPSPTALTGQPMPSGHC